MEQPDQNVAEITPLGLKLNKFIRFLKGDD